MTVYMKQPQMSSAKIYPVQTQIAFRVFCKKKFHVVGPQNVLFNFRLEADLLFQIPASTSYTLSKLSLSISYYWNFGNSETKLPF